MSNNLQQVLQFAPQILGFLGGPAGGLAGAGLTWLADKFGASDQTKESIEKALINADPLEVRKMDIEFQEFCMANNIKVDLAQIAVNVEEAKSASIFVSGWRPFVGWVCASSLLYTGILEPVARFIAKVGFGYEGAFPVIDSTMMGQILTGILGLGAFRTAEKIRGAESNR